MSASREVLMEESAEIAWNYLERAGEMGDPQVAGRLLLDSIELMMRRGVCSRLLLSNRAISDYQKFKHQTPVPQPRRV